MLNNKNILRQIKQASESLNLNEYVIEKDFYVTRAIALICDISNDYYDIVFQGGTSLAKAHRIIERMSEDCDFRMRLKNPDIKLSKEFKRKTLRQFRHSIIVALRAGGFVIEDSAVRVRNEGQFMGIRANYSSLFSRVEMIKPFIALDFFLAEVKIKPEIKPVTTLVRQFFGDTIEHLEFPVNSVAIIETAAEKWVGLTRRIATSKHRHHYRDASLVRHLYDLYCINELGYFSKTFDSLVAGIVLEDRQQYKNHNDDYYLDPISEIKRAVEELHQSEKWQDTWEQFVDIMVFAKQKPSYDDVISNLQNKTDIALANMTALELTCEA